MNKLEPIDKLEQIDRLGKVIADSVHFGEHNDEFMLAQDILDAGYGNVKQAVKEFAETLRKKAKLLYETNREWYENVYVNEIDNLITELYGVDE